MGKAKLKRIEISEEVIKCPFCDAKIWDQAIADTKDYSDAFSPCKHIVLLANDEGSEFESDLLQAIVGDFDLDEQEDSIDEATDKLNITGGIKIATYQKAPSFFGVYYVFAPDKVIEKAHAPAIIG